MNSSAIKKRKAAPNRFLFSNKDLTTESNSIIFVAMKRNVSELIISLSICVSVFLSCSTSQQKQQLQEGDLLFQDLDCGGLCDAIEAVTEGVNGRDFSHCAMIVRVEDSLKVIEAIGSEVRLTPIEDFLERSGDLESLNNIVVARVSDSYKSLVKDATEFAVSKVGEPYDDEFLLSNGKWYCSELLYESFKHANGGKDFFQLYPMTYKVPEKDEFFPVWVDYYKALEKPIPEGQPGLNPGSISRSDKIDVIQLDNLTTR